MVGLNRAKRTTIVLLGGALAVVAAGAAVLQEVAVPRSEEVVGVVVGPRGTPVAGAEVVSGGVRTRTDHEGRFTLGTAAGWVTATAPGYVPRTRAGAPGDRAVIRLPRRTQDTITLAFGGDVMFGRRFYDPLEDGSGGGLLQPADGVAEHQRLLAGVAPLLADADIAAVNLETPLLADPWYDPRRPRPPRFHPSKEFAFASGPAAAEALARTGVDVVDVGNNHLFDALGKGVRRTRQALAAAGYRPGEGYFGAGLFPRQAWSPAVQEVRGQRVAYIGCTSIRGDDQPLTYVAEPGKAGAAACSPGRLARAVKRARAEADIVVAMVHGGYEYGRIPSRQVRALSTAARAAGATLVVNHHPHVVGGVEHDGQGLTAWTLGNLLFDQTVWPTFESYVLNVAVTRGRVSSAWLEPLRLQGYVPTGVYGEDADWVAGGALARSAGPWVVDDGSLWLDTAGAARRVATRLPGPGLRRVDAGCAPGAGRELLWTGDFEALDLADATSAGLEAPLWNVTADDPYRRLDPDAAHHGRAGVLLHRASANSSDVILTVAHRVLIGQRHRLTLLLDHRSLFGQPAAALQLSWYNDTLGSSQERTLVPIEAGDSWGTLRVDVRAPQNAVAVQPFVRLAPPQTGVTQLAVDDVRLVDWDEPGCDYVRGPVVLQGAALPPVEADPRATDVAQRATPIKAPDPLPPTSLTPVE